MINELVMRIKHHQDKEWRKAVYVGKEGEHEDVHHVFIWRENDYIRGVRVVPTSDYIVKESRVVYSTSVGRFTLNESLDFLPTNKTPAWVIDELKSRYDRYDSILRQKRM